MSANRGICFKYHVNYIIRYVGDVAQLVRAHVFT